MIGLLILACLGAAIGVAVLVYLLLDVQVRRARRERGRVERALNELFEVYSKADPREDWADVLARAEEKKREISQMELR